MPSKRFQFLIILLVFFAACKKESVKIINLSDPYMDGRGIVLNWEYMEIPGFKYYQILRSTNGKDFYFIDNPGTPDSGLLNINKTTYTDILYPVADNVYYKVAAFGDEIVASNMVGFVVPKPLTLHFQPEATYIIPEKGQILFFNSNEIDSYFYLFDYINNTLLDSIKLSFEYSYAIGFGDFPENHEFYFYNFSLGNIKMAIYNIEPFNKMAEFDFLAGQTDVITNKTNSIYYAYFDNIFCINRETYINRLYYSDIQNKLIGIASDLVSYDLDTTGIIIGETAKYLNLPYGSVYIEGTSFIYGSNYLGNILINIENGLEYNISELCEGLEEVSCFYSKNNVLYLYGELNIFCYSLPDLNLIEKIPTRIDPDMILSDDYNLFLFEFVNGSETVIDNIKLTQ
jgi:hypothetical protein